MNHTPCERCGAPIHIARYADGTHALRVLHAPTCDRPDVSETERYDGPTCACAAPLEWLGDHQCGNGPCPFGFTRRTIKSTTEGN